MRSLILVTALLMACGDSGDITPAPDATSSTGNSMGGSDGNGGAPTAGNGPAGGGVPMGGNGETGTGWDNGTRLKTRTRVGADGSRQPVGWHDQNINAYCSWRKASDGSDRCLPDGYVANRYADSDCLEPIVVRDDCEDIDFALTSETVDGCGSRWRAWPLGVIITPAVAFQKSGGNCVSASVPGGEIWSTNAELPASMFVGATVEIEP